MMIFIISLTVMLLIVAAMAIGVMIAKKPIKGSCGGLSALGMKDSCMICGNSKRSLQSTVKRSDLAVDVGAHKTKNRTQKTY